MEHTLHRIATIALILTALLLGACAAPNSYDMGHPWRTVYALHIMNSDGTGHRILATGSIGEVLLADSSIFVTQYSYGLLAAAYGDSSATQLYAGIDFNFCSLSMDRSKVLLTSISPAGNELYVMNANGTHLAKLEAPIGAYALPQLSPDLDEIAFSRQSCICTMYLDGSNFQTIRVPTDTSQCDYPRYVDQNRLLYTEIVHYTTWTNTGWISLRLFDKNNRTDSPVTEYSRLLYSSAQNAFSGDTLLCIDMQESYASLLNLNSKQVTALRPARWASFSPDGSMIICGDSRDIGIIKVASGNAQLVYSEPDANQWVVDAEISPDNKYIVFRTLVPKMPR